MLLFGGLITAFIFMLTDTGGDKTATVPKLVGLNQAAAGDALRAVKLNPQFSQEYDNTVPSNTVLRAEPRGGHARWRRTRRCRSCCRRAARRCRTSGRAPRCPTPSRRSRRPQLTPVRGTDDFDADVPQGAVIRTGRPRAAS